MGKGGKGGVRVIQKGPKGMGQMAGMAGKTPQEVQQSMMQDMMKDMMNIDECTQRAMMRRVVPDDRSSEQRWPQSAKNASVEMWQTIWPNNLDSMKTMKMGRKISMDDAVERPDIEDLHEALATLGLRHVIEPFKYYPRDIESHWHNMGRVRVELIDDVTEDYCHPEVEGKIALLRMIAKLVKGSEKWKKRREEQRKEEEITRTMDEEQVKSKQVAVKKVGNGGGGKSKKKGKKKK